MRRCPGQYPFRGYARQLDADSRGLLRPARRADRDGSRCALGDLHAGGEALIQLTAAVAADASGPIVNVATVRGNRGELNESSETATSTIHVTLPPSTQPASDLVVRKHVDRAVALVGERLRYTITVTNKGPGAAMNVTTPDVLSLPVRVVSLHPGQGHCQTGPPITCGLGTLDPGAHTTITIVVVASVAGEELNTAAAMSASGDPDPRNSIATVKTTILAHRARPPQVTG